VGRYGRSESGAATGPVIRNTVFGQFLISVIQISSMSTAAGSASGLTVKVTGFSAMAGFIVTVVVAPKDHPPLTRWWGATAWAASSSEIKEYEEGR
jgi:hypothetical protein